MILFPLDRPDGVHVCVSVNVCAAAPAGLEKSKKKKRKTIPPDGQDLTFHTFHQSVHCLEGKTRATIEYACQVAGILMSGLTDQSI